MLTSRTLTVSHLFGIFTWLKWSTEEVNEKHFHSVALVFTVGMLEGSAFFSFLFGRLLQKLRLSYSIVLELAFCLFPFSEARRDRVDCPRSRREQAAPLGLQPQLPHVPAALQTKPCGKVKSSSLKACSISLSFFCFTSFHCFSAARKQWFFSSIVFLHNKSNCTIKETSLSI